MEAQDKLKIVTWYLVASGGSTVGLTQWLVGGGA